MNTEEAKKITLSLLETFNEAGRVALKLREAGLKTEIKADRIFFFIINFYLNHNF